MESLKIKLMETENLAGLSVLELERKLKFIIDLPIELSESQGKIGLNLEFDKESGRIKIYPEKDLVWYQIKGEIANYSIDVCSKFIAIHPVDSKMLLGHYNLFFNPKEK